MTIYCNKNEDGSLLEWSEIENERFTEQSDDEIVVYEGKFWLKNDIPKKKYNEYKTKKEKEDRIIEINKQLKILDEKRIRAICEPSVKDETSGETWLDYYNLQVQNLRQELSNL